MMDVTAGNHGNLERYLLGTLPDGERDRIDERLLVDAELFEALCVIENELAYDYALGLLTPEERSRFEQRFIDRPAVQARVRTAAALIGGMRDAEPARAKYGWWLYAAAAAGVVLMVWLVQDNARLRQAAERRMASTAVTESAPTPAPAVKAPQSSATSAQSQTASSIVALVLQPGVVRSSAAPARIRLRDSDTLRLELALPAASTPSASYRASIRNPDDVQVWEGAAAVSKAGRAVTLTVPAGSLPPNDYEVTLYSVPTAGSHEEIASYQLSVAR